MKKTILVIARDPETGATCRRLLESWDYDVPAVVTAENVMRMLSTDVRPALAVICLDGSLEDAGILAGMRLSSELDVPVVYLSSRYSEDQWNRIKVSNPVGYLLMPFDPGAFKAMVDIALQDQEPLDAYIQRNRFMMRETHHLIKNSLQIISSLITSQDARKDTPSKNGAWSSFRDRLRAVALAHELLGLNSFSLEVDFGEYARRLIHHLNTAYSGQGGGVEIILSLEPVMIHAERIVPLGLLLSELITNALRHAFLPGSRGRLTVTLAEESDGAFKLVVEDNGRGVPDGFTGIDASGRGVELIRMLADQLGGAVVYRNADPGTICEIQMKGRPG